MQSSFLDLHRAFLDKQSRLNFYRVNGLTIAAFPYLYHPEASSSSVFFLKSILKYYQNVGSSKNRLLDMGCGTGIVGLGLSQYFKEIYLSDISQKAVFCTKLNALLNFKKANIFVSNLFENVPKNTLFDTITFNVPFLDKVIENETEIATNDPSGQIFLKFIEHVSHYLAPQGEVFFGYSNLGNLATLRKIPDTMKLEKLAYEHFAETGTDRTVYRLTLG